MKVLVTGSTGFVGSHLCERLEKEGHEVFALARNQKKFKQFKVPGKLVLGTLEHDKAHSWVDQLPEDLDAVIHTAGVVHSFDKTIFERVNTKATEQLIDDLIPLYPNLKFVFISSLAASGPSHEKIEINEEKPLSPPSLYGKSKKRAEEILNQKTPKGWDVVTIRPPMVIGPRDPAVLDIFKMIESRLVLMAGMDGPRKLYSFVCVHDLVEVIFKAMITKGLKGQSFFASYPAIVSQSELINEIKKQMNKKALHLRMPMPFISAVAHVMSNINKVTSIDFRLTPDKLHELEPEAWICSGKKASDVLGVEYKWNLEKTIGITLEDYKQRGWIK